MVVSTKDRRPGVNKLAAWSTVLWLPAAAVAGDDGKSAANKLEEIVVSAQRRAESIDDVPIAITAQTAEDLRQAGVADVRDLGNVVPGLTYGSQGPFGSPAIRGIQSRIGHAGNEQPVATYVDGVYQPNQLATLMDLADVTQVEVLKGPQGTLFGRNTTGGAIMIHTIQPQYETSGKLGLEYGYYTGSDERAGEKNVRGYITGPVIDRRLAYSLSGLYRSSDGYMTNDLTGNSTGEAKNYVMRGKLLWNVTDNLSFLLTASKGDRDDAAVFATQPLNGNSSSAFYPDGIVTTEPWHVAAELKDAVGDYHFEQEAYSLKAEWVVDGLGTFSSQTAYTDNDIHYTSDLDAGYSPQCKAAFACLDYYSEVPSETLQQELLFTSERLGRISFVAGAYYFDDESKSVSTVAPVLTSQGKAIPSDSLIDYVSAATIYTKSWAIFGEMMYDVTDRLHLIAGLRYSDEKKHGEGNFVPRFPTTGTVSEDAWTPRVSLRYDLNDDTNVYATISKGFKSAVLSTAEQSDAFAKSEEVLTYELGLKSGSDQYRMSLAAFYYDYSDFQTQVWNGSRTILDNAKKADIYGMELEGVYSLNANWRVRATAAYLHTRYGDFTNVAFELPNGPAGMTQNNSVDVTGNQMLLSPKFTSSLSLAYDQQTPLGEVETNASLYYSDEYWFDFLERNKQDAYTTLNASLTLVPMQYQAVRLALYGRNLTNKKYFKSSLPGNTADSIVYAPPRQFGLSIDFSF